MQLSIIILNYNVRFFLEQCIKAVQAATTAIEAEIIVVDNNSQDGSAEMMRQLFPELLYIENKENMGFPKGNNMGVQEAKGEYICILNPDTVVAEDSFLKLLHLFKSREGLGIVGCKMIDGRGEFLPESKRGIPTYWRSLMKVTGFYKLFPTSSIVNGYYAAHLSQNTSGAVEILVGAFMFMPKHLYLTLGGFDERFFMYVEDTDLSYASLKAGYENFYFADTTVIHYKGESTIKDLEYVKRFHRGIQIFYEKHFRKSYLFDLLMRLITFVFLLFKQKKHSPKLDIVSHTIVVSPNKHFKKQVERALERSIEHVEQLDKLQEILHQKVQSNGDLLEIVFDGDYLTNKEIITFMHKNYRSEIIYKIKPVNSLFLIGSNDSNSKGSVIILEE
ncbi:glycosyltransferase family 2 protein [Myroides sp. DF42-4-2]|uniref:glycosyltransferase family 2 protein n=1 Tax=unclassified Myroides TaxID=2642485 RepID=UPI002575848E|nr:glycosyltransferase family 2 protein [Myroides sp. DF42-4-2]MDM1406582.1 glycosyltransferase family 2 protein [Myroides sp. DF42-4-2]